jgi:predicted PurR-regulated permease PerM
MVPLERILNNRLLLILITAGVSLLFAGVIFYFVFSNKAKVWVAEFKAKVMRIIEYYKKRIEELERKVTEVVAENENPKRESAEAKDLLSKWKSEGDVSSALGIIAGSALSVEVISRAVVIIKGSPLLMRFRLHPSQILPYLDAEYARIELQNRRSEDTSTASGN